MNKTIPLFFLAFALLLGFWFGSPSVEKRESITAHPEREYPVTHQMSFVFVVYGDNAAPWCERSLRSIFEQDSDAFRVIFVDDGSRDGTADLVRSFVEKSNQEHRVILMQSETSEGMTAAMVRAIEQVSDGEIVIPMEAKDWLAQTSYLNKLNSAYQNPDVWMTVSPTLGYPSFNLKSPSLSSFYAALFKQIHLKDLYQMDHFAQTSQCWQQPLNDLAGGRCRIQTDPSRFSNEARPTLAQEEVTTRPYLPLHGFPSAAQIQPVDLLIFSYDRPMQLYSCLESIGKYCTHLGQVSILYRASDERFAAAYEVVKKAYPLFSYVKQSSKKPKRDFKPKVLELFQQSPSPYILFAVDDLIVKEEVDLARCGTLLEKTGAFAFFLRLGKNIDFCYQNGKEQPVPPSTPVGSGVYAWDFRTGLADWHFPNNLDMTLYRKADLKRALETGKYETPNSLEQTLMEKVILPEGSLGLYFEQSKIVNIPLNVMSQTGNPHMNFMSAEELLSAFNQGLKIDIDMYTQVENRSPHLPQAPEFVTR